MRCRNCFRSDLKVGKDRNSLISIYRKRIPVGGSCPIEILRRAAKGQEKITIALSEIIRVDRNYASEVIRKI